MGITRKEIAGLEFDWFAVDSNGLVGHFSTAGYGPVPSILLQNFTSIKSLPNKIQALPIKTTAVGHSTGGNISDWLEMAARGCHSFDWEFWSVPYIRVATPSDALTVHELPADLVSLIQLVVLPVSFAQVNAIRPEKLCSCEEQLLHCADELDDFGGVNKKA